MPLPLKFAEGGLARSVIESSLAAPLMVPLGSVRTTLTVCDVMRLFVQAENGRKLEAGIGVPLKLTAKDLLGLKVIDEMIPEPAGGAHRDPAKTAENLGKVLRKHLSELAELTPHELVKDRYEKFRALGVFSGR